MRHKKFYELNEEMIDKIISVAYDDASLRERIFVYRAAASDEKVKELLVSYRSTAKEVRQINEEEFPDELLQEGKLANLPTNKIKNYFLNDLVYIVFTRPLAAASACLILITVIITAIALNRPVEYKYTDVEIRIADKQARYALAIVGKIFDQTKITLKNEIFQDKIGRPIKESFGIVNKLFNEEGEIQ
jgi:hypothetical protein